MTAPAHDGGGWFANIIWRVTSYFGVIVTVTLVWFFLYVLNRTIVVGREHASRRPARPPWPGPTDRCLLPHG